MKFQSEFWFILIILIRTIYFPSLLTAAFCCVWSFFFHYISDNKLFCKELTLHLKTWHKIEIKSIHDFGRIFSCLKLLTIYSWHQICWSMSCEFFDIRYHACYWLRSQHELSTYRFNPFNTLIIWMSRTMQQLWTEIQYVLQFLQKQAL